MTDSEKCVIKTLSEIYNKDREICNKDREIDNKNRPNKHIVHRVGHYQILNMVLRIENNG